MNKFTEVYFSWSAASSRASYLIDKGWTATLRRSFVGSEPTWVVEFTR
ncbi:hypothetical protein PAK_P100080 [Pseudomonas phage PAK_P1]|uniref:Uncharacterized protein n=1 Tax=Pseudomonas phage PAK_P1 TaxID=743813 RepID=V5K302_9CAUD|nr:hypothetical protein PAK_P100080 [Pseudomonas phage PAK_P1]AGS81768.1 hypothetical protein PAK_P100080 [Pseudomonas phage PAK_P1]